MADKNENRVDIKIYTEMQKIAAEARIANTELGKTAQNLQVAKVILDKMGNVKSLTLVNQETKKISKNTQEMQSNFSKFSKALTTSFNLGKLYLLWNITKRIRDMIKGWITASVDFIETTNKFEVAMGKASNQAYAFQNKLSNAFGTVTKEMMNYQATFKNIMSSLPGLTNDAAEQVSETLVKLGLDYSSLYNVDQSVAMSRIQSALVGSVKPIRNDAGYDITEATIGMKASQLGITTSVRNLNQMEKRLLRIIVLMDQMRNTGAMQDLARTIEQPANQIKILKNQIQELGVWLGNVFIGTIGKILPYINGFVMALVAIVKTLAIFVGYTNTGSGLAEGLEVADDATQGIASGFGSAAKSAKELKKTLMGFDVLNIIQTPSESSGGGGGGGGSPEAIDPAILNALKDYDNLMGSVQMKATQIRDKIMDWLGFTKIVNEETGEITWKLKDGYTNIEKIKDILQTIGIIFASYKISSGIINFLDKLGFIKDKSSALRVVAGLAIEIAGITLLYQGIKKIVKGQLDAESILEVAGGTGLIISGAALQFKKIALLKIGLLATFDIGVGLSIVKWWNQYFDDMKKELYNNKKDLNVGEFLYVSLNAVGEGAWKFIDSIFGKNFKTKIQEYFKKNQFGRFILSEIMNSLTLGLMSSEIKQKPENIGEEIIDGVSDGAKNAMFNSFLGPLGPIVTGLEKLSSLFRDWKDKFGTIKDWYNEKIAPWFTKEKWENVAQERASQISSKFQNFKNAFNIIKSWFEEKIAPWFTKEKWTKLSENATLWIQNKFNEFKINFRPIKDWWDSHVAPWFSKEKWKQLGREAISGIKETLSLERISFKLPHISWQSGGSQASGTLKKILEILNLPTSLPKLNVSWYKNGGFPDIGEMFIAREAGPELVGSIGGRNAVMNNEQIVEAVSSGVANAVASVMGNGGSSFQLIIDGEQITNVVQRRIARRANITGMAMGV